MTEPIYQFVFPPYHHQWKELSTHGLDRHRAWWWAMRTGKSAGCINAACALFRRFEIQRVLIIAPNGVQENWVRKEIPKHVTVPWRAEYWSSALSKDPKRKEEYLARMRTLPDYNPEQLTFLAINNKSMLLDRVRNLVARFIQKPILLIVDESHNFGNGKAQTTQRLKAWVEQCDYVRLLSGTPVGNSPLNLHAQYEMFREQCLGFTSFEEFKERYHEYVMISPNSGRPFEKHLGYKNLDDLKVRIAPYTSVVTRKDCPDLPPVIRSCRYFEMTPKQRRLYEKLKKELLLEHAEDGVFVDGTTGAKVLMKLHQLTRGFVIDEGDVAQPIMHWSKNPAIKCLIDLLKETFQEGGKAIVWCDLRRYEMQAVSDALTHAGYRHVQYHGGVPQRLRAPALDAFQNDPAIKVFLGQPQSGGQGLDLSAAKAVVWYSHTNKCVVRDQADERGTQMGDEPVMVTDIIASRTVDERILKTLFEGMDVADDVAGNGLKPYLADV